MDLQIPHPCDGISRPVSNKLNHTTNLQTAPGAIQSGWLGLRRSILTMPHPQINVHCDSFTSLRTAAKAVCNVCAV
jgi:hypothetical protein